MNRNASTIRYLKNLMFGHQQDVIYKNNLNMLTKEEL